MFKLRQHKIDVNRLTRLYIMLSTSLHKHAIKPVSNRQNQSIQFAPRGFPDAGLVWVSVLDRITKPKWPGNKSPGKIRVPTYMSWPSEQFRSSLWLVVTNNETERQTHQWPL